MQEYTVTTMHTLTQQFLWYVAVAAVEGGSNYWANFSDWNPQSEPEIEVNVSCSEQAVKKTPVTEELLLKGIQALLDGKCRCSRQLVSTLRCACATGDAGDVDAELADVILQVALLGEIVYG